MIAKNVTIRVALLLLVALVAVQSVPAQQKAAPAGAQAARAAHPKSVTGVVNINTASVADLSLLPRVGESVAQRIVEYRDKNGGFKKVEELLNVRGIGERSLETLRPHVTLTGSTTIKAAS